MYEELTEQMRRLDMLIKKQKSGATKKYNDEYWYNHPYFLKKDEQARKSIAKHGFPAELLKIQA